MNKIFWKIIYCLSAIIGIVSAIWGYETYLLTFINPMILFGICLATALLVFRLIRQHYSMLYKTNGTHFPFLQSLLSVGLIVPSTFLIINNKLPTADQTTEIHKIIETGILGGKNHKPYAIIERNNQIKKLVFKQNPTINVSGELELVIQTGYFGFEIIVEQRILNK